MTFYIHWRDAPAAAWCWPNLSLAEIACRGTGKATSQAIYIGRRERLTTDTSRPSS